MSKFEVLGKDKIIEEMKNGAELTYISGRFGGWIISVPFKTVRSDSCFNLEKSGLLKVKERSFGRVTYYI